MIDSRWLVCQIGVYGVENRWEWKEGWARNRGACEPRQTTSHVKSEWNDWNYKKKYRLCVPSPYGVHDQKSGRRKNDFASQAEIFRFKFSPRRQYDAWQDFLP